jgi:hypothetical protein
MRLPKLPDRTPVKLTTTLQPALATRLRAYTEFYAETYGTREEVADLVPFMLEAFLDGGRGFPAGDQGSWREGLVRSHFSES